MQITQGLEVDTYQITATADEVMCIRHALSTDRAICLQRRVRDKKSGVFSPYDFATQGATCGELWHDIYVAVHEAKARVAA